MAIDFNSVSTADNYSTAFVPKLQESQKGLACWLDPATISYTNTPYTGAYRYNSTTGTVEKYNGTSWVAQAINGINYSGGNVGIGAAAVGTITLAVQSAAGNSSNPTLRAGNGTANILFLPSDTASSWNTLAGAGDQAIIFSGGAAADSSASNLVIGPWSASAKGMRINNAGSVSIGMTGVTYKLNVNGDAGANNWWIGTGQTTDVGFFGLSTNGPQVRCYGSGSGGGGVMVLAAGTQPQVYIYPVTTAVNWNEFRGAAAGASPSWTANGSDANVGLNLVTKGTGSINFTLNGAVQAQFTGTASATRYLTFTGSNGANPTISTSGGKLGIGAPLRVIGSNSIAGDVAATYVQVDSSRVSFVDSSRTTDNHANEFLWTGGVFYGRFVNDGYTLAQQWLTVTGGEAAGITQLSLYAGGLEQFRATSSGIKVGTVAGNANRDLDVAGGAMTSPVTVAYSATPTFDASTSNYFILGALTGNVTGITISNGIEGQFITIRVVQDGTGGRTFASPGSVVGSLNLGAGKTSFLNLTWNATAGAWQGSWLQIP